MKTILVPTDFSATANNAAHYALHLAKGIKANIKLCHAIRVPAEAPMAAQVAWPLEDYTSLKKEATADLMTLSDKLSKEGEAITNHQTYHPVINYETDLGGVSDIVRNSIKDQYMTLVVMGMSGASGLSRVFLGSNSRELIEKASFPLLLIPAEAKFGGVKKIAFATDLRKNDLETLNRLTGLARGFDADILIVHVTAEKGEAAKQQHQVDNFLNDITCKLNYPKIYYRDIKSTDIDHGLEWLAAHGQIDILAMVHRPHSWIGNLIEGSHTQRIAKKINIPLLVFPNENLAGMLQL